VRLAPESLLALILALLMIVAAAITLVERSDTGRRLRAMGEDATLAGVQGIDCGALRLAVNVASGAIAGLGGALQAFHAPLVRPDMLGLVAGVEGIAHALVGGLGSLGGPLLAVAADVALLRATGLPVELRTVVLATVTVLVLLRRPRGLIDEAFLRDLRAHIARGRTDARR